MGRLFAGTPLDRPPRCERCGELEEACQCPPPPVARKHTPPEKQTARIQVEKRPKGKVVTVVRGLDPEGTDLESLTSTLKSTCGTGGTVKEGTIEIQGDHRDRVEAALSKQGFKVKPGK